MKRKVFITGAARGIGLATARMLHEAGYEVLANYRTRTEEVLTLEKQGVTVIAGDVCCPDDMARISQFIAEADILINNAGIAQVKPFTDISLADWDAVMNVNLRAVFHCTSVVVPAMLAKKRGCIVNISSVWGEVGGSCEVAYSAAKAGVIGFTRALAKELGPSGIRVNAIAPGVIDTDMNTDLTPRDIAAISSVTPLVRIGKPEEVARAVLYLIENEFVAGEVLHVDGGWRG